MKMDYQIDLADATDGDEIGRVYYINFNSSMMQSEASDSVRPVGTLILANKENTVLYTAELVYQPDTVSVKVHKKFVFDDKSPKIMKIFPENSPNVFLVNSQAPFKMYALSIEPDESSIKGSDVQIMTKVFKYIYETNLELNLTSERILDFDLYLQEKKGGPQTYIVFMRELTRVHILGIDEKLINTLPVRAIQSNEQTFLTGDDLLKINAEEVKGHLENLISNSQLDPSKDVSQKLVMINLVTIGSSIIRKTKFDWNAQ